MTRDYIRNVEQKIVETMAQGLEEGKLKEEELQEIANLALSRIEKVTSHDQVIGFLAELSVKWPVFSHIALEEESKLKKHIENHVAKNVLQLINQDKVKDAISLAKMYIK